MPNNANGLYLCSAQTGYELGELTAKHLSKKMDSEIGIEKIICREGHEQFSVGEIKNQLPSSVRGKKVYMFSSPVDRTSEWSVNDNLVDTWLSIDSLKFCHAKSINVIQACLAYARQDTRSGREPLSIRLWAQYYAVAGATDFMTMDMHANQIKGYFEAAGIRIDAPYASPILLEYLQNNVKINDYDLLIVDGGNRKRTKFFAEKMYGKDNARAHIKYADKDRPEDEANTTYNSVLLSDVKGRGVMLIEDMVDTMSTGEPQVRNSHDGGAEDIIIVATHTILSGPAVKILDDLYETTNFSMLLTTNSVAHPPEIKEKPWFEQLDISPLIAELIYRIHNDIETSSTYL